MAALDNLGYFGEINLASWDGTAVPFLLAPDCVAAEFSNLADSRWQLTLEVAETITSSAGFCSFTFCALLASTDAGAAPLRVLGSGPSIGAVGSTDAYVTRFGFAGLRVSFEVPAWQPDYFDGTTWRTVTRPGFLFAAIQPIATGVVVTAGRVRLYGSLQPPVQPPLFPARF